MNKKLMCVIFCFSVLSFAKESDEREKRVKYWSDTGINISYLNEYINDKSCHKEKEKFIACMDAVGTLIQEGYSLNKNKHSNDQDGATVALIAEDDAQQEVFNELGFAFGAKLKNFGPINLVELKIKPSAKNKLSVSKFRNLYKKKLEAKIAVLTKIYSDNNGLSVNFNELIRYAAELVKGKKEEAQIVGATLNIYLAAAVDPHTHLNPVGEMNDNSKSMDQSFVGIGAELRKLNDQIIVVKPMKGGSALAAGLKAGDIITHVDGNPVQLLPLEKAIGLIRGEKDTFVTLHVIRKETSLTFKLKRAPVITQNVSYEVLNDSDVNMPIGYIKFNSFMENGACKKIAKALVELQKQQVMGIVLDLRGNGGGLLDQAICIGGLFLGSKPVVGVKDLVDQNSEIQFYSSRIPDKFAFPRELPFVTLIDSGSASASEIVAGALQDHQRSWIVGERSFGKGTVQSGMPWDKNNNLLLFETTQRFYQPSGRTNQVVGIQPNFEVYSKPNPTEEDLFALREADFYTNALPSLSEPWKETRADKVQNIQNCMNSSGKAITSYNERENEALAPDFQLLTAQDVIMCDLKMQ